MNGSVHLCVCRSHLFHNVPVNVSSPKFSVVIWKFNSFISYTCHVSQSINQLSDSTLTNFSPALCVQVTSHSGGVSCWVTGSHDDVIKWKHFPCNWPFVRGIHWSPVNSPHKGQWCKALMFSFICIWINDWVNNREAGDLRRYHVHFDVLVMPWWSVKLHAKSSFSNWNILISLLFVKRCSSLTLTIFCTKEI